MYVTLDRPRPLWHVVGDGACDRIALLILVTADSQDQYSVSQVRHTNGCHVDPLESLSCDACGRLMDTRNFLQLLHDGEKTPIDPLRAAMVAAIERAERGIAHDTSLADSDIQSQG